MTCCMLSTIDNPFNPFEDYSSWLMFDKEKGYDSKVGETIVIKTEDLKENSSVYEERICDCCGTLYGKTKKLKEQLTK